MNPNYIEPFEMIENLYFVGSKRVCVHVIKTSEGLVMFDTGWPDMYDEIIENMHALGLDEKDICAIFHSHGHIDHFGCTQKLKEISGAKTYISRIDNDLANNTVPLSWAVESGYPFTPFDCDVLIEDGDCFTFGDITIRCRLTPGHTEGTTSFFITMPHEGKEIVAAMFGGFGRNTMTKAFLEKYNISTNCIKHFRQSLQSAKDEVVNLVLGNHPGNNDTEGKLALKKANQSVLDDAEWVAMLERHLVGLEEFIIEQNIELD